VVSLAQSMPWSFKYRHGQSKWILRQCLERYGRFPMVATAKKGFGIPLAEWLRGPLAPWVQDHLAPSSIDASLFDRAEVSRLQRDFARGNDALQYLVYNATTLSAWLSNEREGQACEP